jgi:hypothetical protein
MEWREKRNRFSHEPDAMNDLAREPQLVEMSWGLAKELDKIRAREDAFKDAYAYAFKSNT